MRAEARAVDLFDRDGSGMEDWGEAPYGGVLDRTAFVRAMEMAGRMFADGGEPMLLVLDINHFQWINDAYGVGVGDAVLALVGGAVKRAAGPDAVVGRLDGDRFGVLVSLPGGPAATGLAREILALVNAPVDVEGHVVHLTARIGISPYVTGADPVTSTLRYAGAALSEAKDVDANGAIVLAHRHWAPVDRRARICRELGRALEEGRLGTAYQPIVDLRTRHTVGFEALLRWPTPDGIEIPPGEFVPIAEELGLIERIGAWALHQAIHAASVMPEAPAPTMAVNLSPRQFSSPALLPFVIEALRAYDLDPRRLAFEITEGLAVNDHKAGDTLKALRDVGCRVGLDDFGTGQSCLSYLRSLPLDFIKIDRSFVAELDTDPRAVRLVHTIAAMASDLGLATVAEGIETNRQYQIAADAGCAFGQGYLFGRPACPSELHRFN